MKMESLNNRTLLNLKLAFICCRSFPNLCGIVYRKRGREQEGEGVEGGGVGRGRGGRRRGGRLVHPTVLFKYLHCGII